MGQELSCGERRRESGLFHAVQDGELELVEAMVEAHPSVLELTIGYGRLSALHVAAANGRIQVSFLFIWVVFFSDLWFSWENFDGFCV